MQRTRDDGVPCLSRPLRAPDGPRSHHHSFDHADRYLGMRELERETSVDKHPCARVSVIGRGRLGHALTPALRAAGYEVDGPLGRGADGANADVVLLCVPDAEIAAAAAAVAPGSLIGHCSGATTLDVLAGRPGFSLHPLMTVTHDGGRFDGAGAAVAGTCADALEVATHLATALGMRPVRIADADRPAYHAAASIASNFLVTVEAAAERLAATAGVGRELLVPLVRATVENWAATGPERALTGPVARGDERTVAAGRAAVAERAPELVELFDALVVATAALAQRTRSRNLEPALR